MGLVDTEDMVPCLSIRVSSERQASILVTVSSFYKGTKDRAPGLVFANMSSHMVSSETEICVKQESFFLLSIVSDDGHDPVKREQGEEKRIRNGLS